MPPAFEQSKPPLSSLATKFIAFVCLCTTATALLVSWISIHTTYAHIQDSLAERFPRALERTAAAVSSWRAQRPAGAPIGPEARRQLLAILDRERDGAARMFLTGADGEVLIMALAPDVEAPSGVAASALEHAPGLQDYNDPDGVRVMGATLSLPGGWHLLVEDPLRRAFAPVTAVLARVFAADLLVIVVFSLLGYKITTAVVRPIETLSEAARRIAQGQFDHEVPEPELADEVGLLSRTFNDMMRRLRGYQNEIEAANTSLKERNVELQQAKETFEQLSITDGLTKLHNHRFFQDHLTREIKRVNRSGDALSMLLIDIDDFKQLNDRFGHAAGDQLLTGLASIMNETIRETDLLARYGGEEFVVLATGTELDGAYGLAEKIRTAAAENSFVLDDSKRPVRVTVSIGVARYRGNRKTFFVAADRALYRAKDAGKNCVMMDEEDDLA